MSPGRRIRSNAESHKEAAILAPWQQTLRRIPFEGLLFACQNWVSTANHQQPRPNKRARWSSATMTARAISWAPVAGVNSIQDQQQWE